MSASKAYKPARRVYCGTASESLYPEGAVPGRSDEPSLLSPPSPVVVGRVLAKFLARAPHSCRYSVAEDLSKEYGIPAATLLRVYDFYAAL